VRGKKKYIPLLIVRPQKKKGKRRLKKGVYSIKHINSDKRYIESSFDLARRLTDHISNRSSNIHLQRAINKHGINNINFLILELLPNDA